jgi:hypothetical protein
MKNRMRAAIGVAAITALFAIAPIHRAVANDFTESCTAGSGLFDDAGCKCLDGKVTDGGERTSLMAYFKMQADTMKGITPAATSAASSTLQKGTDLMGKYSAECLK